MEEADKTKRTEYFEPLQDIPHFWRWDLTPDDHKVVYEKNMFMRGDREYSRCCFNHAIGLPVKSRKNKDGTIEEKIYPMFDWQKTELFDKLEGNKYVWIKKATGMGVTEFMLRWMAWKALTSPVNTMRDAEFCFVTGPNIDLAKDIMDRLKSLFIGYSFPEKNIEAKIGIVTVKAFPSHHLDAMRGRPNVRVVLLDEADFFPIGEQENARIVSERYIGKSGSRIIMVSTPNLPGGLYEKIENEKDSIYHKVFLPYTLGIGTIYTQEEILEAQKSPNFEREYNLKYGYGIGNVFTEDKIQAAILKWDEIFKPLQKIPESVDTYRVMGVDPGFGSSKVGVVIAEFLDGMVRIIYAHEFENSTYEYIIPKVFELYKQQNCRRMFVDGWNVTVIKSMKQLVGENPDYDHVEPMNPKHKGDLRFVSNMEIVPVSFLRFGREMLGNSKLMMDKGLIAIPREFKTLIDQLRVAKTRDNGDLEKSSHPLDLIDAFRLALHAFNFGVK